jgi:hypothetical protein
MKVVFDIETNGLYDDVSCIHCLAYKDLETKEVFIFNDTGSKQSITAGITHLMEADLLIGHNSIGYDLPVIKKLYPFFQTSAQTLDTLILSRIYHADMLKLDGKRNWPQMPAQLYGRHSLESWGYRLGEYKGGFAKNTDWKEWSQDMEDYMVQDVNVTTKLWSYFVKNFLTTSS